MSFRQSLSPVIVLGLSLFWTKSLDPGDTAGILTSLTLMFLISDLVIDIEYFYDCLEAGSPALDIIQNFLRRRELPIPHRMNATSTTTSGADHPIYAVQLIDATISLDGENIFNNLTLEILKNNIYMVFGPAGCGKSTLLKVLLGEIHPSQGSVSSVHSSIGYCGETPWLPAGSVRDTIIGTNVYDIIRYRAVLLTCCLDVDLLAWPNGDQSSIEEIYDQLTEDQKQRLVSYLDDSYIWPQY